MKLADLTPLYLIVGEDDLKRESMRKRLVKRFATMGDVDFNMDVFKGDKSDVDDIVQACLTLPFASDKRLVVVDDLEKMPREGLNSLADYCDNPCETTVLCLVAAKLAKNTRLYKRVNKDYAHSIIDCSPKSRKELPELVASMAQTHGVSITPDGAVRLITFLGDSTILLDSALTKMATALGAGGRITAETVQTMVVRTTQMKPWDLTAALAKRDASQVEAVLEHLDIQSPLGLFANCVSRIRELIVAKTLTSRGQGSSLASYLGRQEWQIRDLRSQAALWSRRDLRLALGSAAETEQALKSGANQALTFEMWLLSLCR